MGISYQPKQLQVTTRGGVLFDEHCNVNPPSSDTRLYISTGSGQTATMVNGTNGAYYEFASGTTANAETIVLFKQSFGVGAKVVIQCDRSSASGVANQETFIELVEVDPALLESSPATAVITSGTDVQVANARNAFQIRWPAASNTPEVWSRRDGNTSLRNNACVPITGAGITASYGTSPNFLPAQNYVLKLGNEGVQAVAANRGGVSTTTTAPSYAQAQNSITAGQSTSAHTPVDTSRKYALRIRVKNGASAPASSVITRIYRVIITEDSPFAIDLFGSGTSQMMPHYGDTQTNANWDAIPVRLVQTASSGAGAAVVVTGSTTPLSVNTLPIFNGTAGVLNSETALGAGGIYTTGTVNFGSANTGNIKFHVLADQASATDGVVIECSNSTGTNWRVLAKGTLVADTPLILTAPLAPVSTSANFFSRYRARVINGGVAQTNFSAVLYGGVIT